MSTEPTFERDRPNIFLRTAFKTPPRLYGGPVAGFFASRCVLKLTTTGRKSGRLRSVCVSFMPHEDGYVIFSGFGVGSNWYQNLLVNPAVNLRIGGARVRATAAVVQKPNERTELMVKMQERSKQCGPPVFMRPFLRLFRAFDYDAEIQMAVDNAEFLPVVRLTPVS